MEMRREANGEQAAQRCPYANFWATYHLYLALSLMHITMRHGHSANGATTHEALSSNFNKHSTILPYALAQ